MAKTTVVEEINEFVGVTKNVETENVESEPIGEKGDYIEITYKDGSLKRRIRGNLDKGEADKVFADINDGFLEDIKNGKHIPVEHVFWRFENGDLRYQAGY